jgi:hypothetical protein
MKVYFDYPSTQISTVFSRVLVPGWNEVDDIAGEEMLRVGLVRADAPDGGAAPDVAPVAHAQLLEQPGPALTPEEVKAVDDVVRETKRGGSRREK